MSRGDSIWRQKSRIKGKCLEDTVSNSFRKIEFRTRRCHLSQETNQLPTLVDDSNGTQYSGRVVDDSLKSLVGRKFTIAFLRGRY